MSGWGGGNGWDCDVENHQRIVEYERKINADKNEEARYYLELYRNIFLHGILGNLASCIDSLSFSRFVGPLLLSCWIVDLRLR